jgi:hypothetical protein
MIGYQAEWRQDFKWQPFSGIKKTVKSAAKPFTTGFYQGFRFRIIRVTSEVVKPGEVR